MKLVSKLLIAALALLMVALGMLFALQNAVLVPLDLLAFQFSPHSLALWLLLALSLGGLLGMLASSALLVRLRATLGASRRELAKARTELDKLRSAGPKDGE